MHRVELKVFWFWLFFCFFWCLFLMHRVELKVLAGLGLVSSWLQFLMHRVELKGEPSDERPYDKRCS